MAEVVKNLLGEDVPIEEAKAEMEQPSREETIIIKGEEIPRRIYSLCINHYLAEQYGDKDL